MSLTSGDVIPGLLQLSTAPVWNTGLTLRKTANNAVYNRVLTYAGARPTDRDSADKRIVTNVRNRNGSVINCVASNGTTVAKERGRLAVARAAHAPADAAVEPEHHGVEWLHEPRELVALHGRRSRA